MFCVVVPANCFDMFLLAVSFHHLCRFPSVVWLPDHIIAFTTVCVAFGSNQWRLSETLLTYSQVFVTPCRLLQVFIDKGPYAGEKLQNDIRWVLCERHRRSSAETLWVVNSYSSELHSLLYKPAGGQKAECSTYIDGELWSIALTFGIAVHDAR